MPVTRIVFWRNGWDLDAIRTMTREHRRCPEYSEIFLTRRVDETGQFGDQTQRGSTQVRWFGQDLARAPNSGIGYTPGPQDAVG